MLNTNGLVDSLNGFELICQMMIVEIHTVMQGDANQVEDKSSSYQRIINLLRKVIGDLFLLFREH